ncbi:hypothetical protein FJTKL_06720 [Diaporthe vaccinii]|uniref:Uncharacterized protein n=1 Tax=Diaporthe vaccinii TaxID=105482 RepID=A0ABR4EWB5_9PEZI
MFAAVDEAAAFFPWEKWFLTTSANDISISFIHKTSPAQPTSASLGSFISSRHHLVLQSNLIAQALSVYTLGTNRAGDSVFSTAVQLQRSPTPQITPSPDCLWSYKGSSLRRLPRP